MRKLRRPSPALVISIIALVVAMGGTSYAALKLPKNSVGSKQVKNNSISSADVKNGGLSAKDFKASKLPRGRVGPQGPIGLTGLPGATGEPGARGPSNGITKTDSSSVDVGSTKTTVLSISLPAGSWIITAGALLNNNDTVQRQGECDINVGTPIVESGAVNLAGNDFGSTEIDRSQLVLTQGVTVASDTPAELRCSIGGASGSNAIAPYVSAIQVASLSSQ